MVTKQPEENIEIRDIRNKDWLWVNKAILDNRKLTASEKIIYFALAYYANNDTQEAYPSTNKIAKLVDVSPRTVTRSVKKLSKLKIIGRVRRTGKSTIYTLLNVTPDKMSPVTNRPYTPDIKDTAPLTNRPSNYTKVNNTNLTIGAQSATGNQINEFIGLFSAVNPSCDRLFRNTTERAASERLIKKYGFEKIKGLVTNLPAMSVDRYFPSITTPYELEVKMGRLRDYCKRKKLSGPVAATIS